MDSLIMRVTLLLGAIVATYCGNALAQSAEQPTPAPSPEATRAGAPPPPQVNSVPQQPNPDLAMTLKNPKFDPCGGYQELLMKYLIGTPCTYKTGQGIVAGQYLAVYAPTGSVLLLNGHEATFNTDANIHIYPRPETLVGIGDRIMLSYYPPTFQELLVNGAQSAAGTGD